LPQPVGTLISAEFAFRLTGEPALIIEWRDILAKRSAEELIKVAKGHWIRAGREAFFYQKGGASSLCFFVCVAALRFSAACGSRFPVFFIGGVSEDSDKLKSNFSRI